MSSDVIVIILRTFQRAGEGGVLRQNAMTAKKAHASLEFRSESVSSCFFDPRSGESAEERGTEITQSVYVYTIGRDPAEELETVKREE